MTDGPHRPSAGRCALVGLVAWGAAGALVWLAAPQLGPAAEGPAMGYVGLLVALCSWVTAASGLWLAVAATLVVLDAARLRAPRRRGGCPRVVQRWLLAACGAALAAGIAAPAVATDGRPEHPPVAQVQRVVEGLPLPDRAVAGPRPARVVTVRVVTVRAGDCLWSIAAHSLPPYADDAAITARWHQIFALNRSVIGTDPDLIRPGLQLRLPRA